MNKTQDIETPSTSVVSGAAGFVGGHLCERLLSEGIRVIGIDDMSLGRIGNLDAAMRSDRFTLLQLDVNALDTAKLALRDALNGVPGDQITFWHLAANSDIAAGAADPDIDFRATFLTTISALKLCREFSIPDFVFSSTSAIYGDLGAAIAEDDGPLFPISNYGAMKLSSEAAISAAAESFLRRVWICRFPNVVGPRATHGVIFDFINKLLRNPVVLEVLGDGTQQKPYLHVAELVNAMCFIWARSDAKRNYFNISPIGSSTSVRRIAELVTEAVSPQATIRFGKGSKGWVGDVPVFGYNVDKLRELGWTPQHTSDEAIERAVREIVAERTS